MMLLGRCRRRPAGKTAAPENPWNDRQAHEVRPHLFLTGLAGLADLSRAEQSRRRFALVVSVCRRHELPQLLLDPAEHLRVNAADSPREDLRRHFEETSARIAECRRRGEDVLVHCAAGISRSAAVVMAHLMRAEGLTLRRAFRAVKLRRRAVEPNPGFLRQLLEWEAHLRRHDGLRPSVDPDLGWPQLPDPRAFLGDTRRRVRHRLGVPLGRSPPVALPAETFAPAAEAEAFDAPVAERWFLYLRVPLRLCGLVAVASASHDQEEEEPLLYVRPTLARVYRRGPAAAVAFDWRRVRSAAGCLERPLLRELRERRLLPRRTRWALLVSAAEVEEALAGHPELLALFRAAHSAMMARWWRRRLVSG